MTIDHTHSGCTIDAKNIVFVGGGNMASAIIIGLLKQGLPPTRLHVIEPDSEARRRLADQFSVKSSATAGAQHGAAELVVWAVKPQLYREAITACGSLSSTALHLSVVTGISCDVIAGWLGTTKVVRCMPNTPALIGKGTTALYAHADLAAVDRVQAENIMRATGDCLWVQDEEQLDAVTALSGAGPAYVFYFLEAMIAAGQQMGLSLEQSRSLAIGTFAGASELARVSEESPQQLRARVTSKAGTTFAATTRMDVTGVKDLFMQAIEVARLRARELGREYGDARHAK